MTGRTYTDETLLQAAQLRLSGLTIRQCADAAGCAKSSMENRLREASTRGFLLDQNPIMDGFRIASVSTAPDGKQHITQKPERGPEFEVPAGHLVKGVSSLQDGDGRIIQQWIKTREDAAAQDAAMRAVVEALKEEIPREVPVPAPPPRNEELLNQYTVTDLHFGMLSWKEETGDDYDLKIAEQMLLDWFAMAIELSPNAATAILAQLGDLLHYDSHDSVTPTHRHILDSDSRYPKMVRVVIRTMRRVVRMLLEKHERVHIIFADANHDPAGETWLREMFALFFEDEPRVTIDTSASTYYAYEFGDTSLFYHHGHKRKINSVDGVFVGKFREIFGRTKYSYAHLGHLHSDELKSAPTTMKVERHETLAAADAFAANGGWLSGRSAKVITYNKRFGEAGRVIITPAMLAAR